ncbi:hypothetical protein PsorP6_008080 [Peronosclerospora sorghi]|uniref:Uncharacterized protein n=1 Tax=Peronosclerospora sorghi TaxID=230839 RepID=A0ACC0WCV8_9STRA|nr:hypothetical protein PsorP6_008080 [Peronosclerospora sorghi]
MGHVRAAACRHRARLYVTKSKQPRINLNPFFHAVTFGKRSLASCQVHECELGHSHLIIFSCLVEASLGRLLLEIRCFASRESSTAVFSDTSWTILTEKTAENRTGAASRTPKRKSKCPAEFNTPRSVRGRDVRGDAVHAVPSNITLVLAVVAVGLAVTWGKR